MNRQQTPMETQIVNKWNSVVSKYDTVFHLGDFSFCNFEKTQSVFSRLNGKIHIIMGNHYRNRSVNWFRNVGFYQVYEYPICYKGFFWLSHAPMTLVENSNYVNVHGHIHSPGRLKQYESILSENHHINVCVEKINFTPLLLEDMIANTPINHVAKKFKQPY